MDTFLQAVQNRRSIYALTKESPVPRAELEDMFKKIMLSCPTAFNMQSTRMVVLFDAKHQRLWDIVFASLQPKLTEERQLKTRAKLDTFAAGFGTVLYFDDTAVTSRYQADYPSYKDTFSDWVLEHNGMLQFAVWAGLESKGLGASIQHYNPVIDDAVKQEYNLPQAWRLLAQMPFGGLGAPADAKEQVPLEQRLRFI